MTEIINNLISIGDYLPFIVFFLLLLGFCMPLSEDLIIITSAIIAEDYRHLTIPLYIAIYLGLLMSDNISYWIGFHAGYKLKKIKWFSKALSEKKISTIQKYLNKYGIFTFIVCRFIPFGVRNTLFLSSGLSKMRYKFFIIYDLIAAAISSSTLYFIVYFLGASAGNSFKTIGIILFAVLLTAVITLILIFGVFRKKKPDADNNS